MLSFSALMAYDENVFFAAQLGLCYSGTTRRGTRRQVEELLGKPWISGGVLF
jgi:hypothetical protein